MRRRLSEWFSRGRRRLYPAAVLIPPGGVNLSLGMLWRREIYFAKERAAVV
jgi:hypothetical protein